MYSSWPDARAFGERGERRLRGVARPHHGIYRCHCHICSLCNLHGCEQREPADSRGLRERRARSRSGAKEIDASYRKLIPLSPPARERRESRHVCRASSRDGGGDSGLRFYGAFAVKSRRSRVCAGMNASERASVRATVEALRILRRADPHRLRVRDASCGVRERRAIPTNAR